LRNTAGSMIPPVSQSKTIKINSVFNAVSQPPNNSATVLPKSKRLIFRYDRKIPDYFSVVGAP
jgi:hypothetical protein